MTARLRPCGASAVLVECDNTAAAVAVAHTVRELPYQERIRDVVPAARTVLITVADPRDLNVLRIELDNIVTQHRTQPGAPIGDPGTEHLIEVHYDGPDLEIVAQAAGLEVAEVIRRHTATTWIAAFGGFAPGFCYLMSEADAHDTAESSKDDRSDLLPAVARRSTPRTHVPAGTVALADRYCGIYPALSPGGWQLIGHTDVVLWDHQRSEPALITPGDRVQFRPRQRPGMWS